MPSVEQAPLTGEKTPYRVRPSGKSVEEVFASVNNAQYLGYGSDYRSGGTGKIVTCTLHDFETLIRGLASVPHFEFVDHPTLLSGPCPPDRVRVAIRHDIDTDIVGALRQAEIEAAYGVRANWVVLHTAPYYGEVRNGVFERHDSMASVYKQLQDLGHEVSLHTDSLSLYQNHGIDGSQAIVTELGWLRSQGIEIRGSTAHNHRATYNAENYEIFANYVRPGDRGLDELPDACEKDGKTAPLRVLDADELGLEYEGNQVFWQSMSPLEYGATRASHQWRWNRLEDRLREQPHRPEGAFIDQPRMLDEIRQIEKGSYLVLVIHPCYYGLRDRPDRGPAGRVNRVSTAVNSGLGWRTYEPDTVQAWSGPWHEPQTFQAISHANAHGMLDMPVREADDTASGERPIVLLGSDNFDGLPVPVPMQLHRRVADIEHRLSSHEPRICKLAHPGMGVDRLWSWYDAMAERLHPGVVVIGIGDTILEDNNPDAWSLASGFSQVAPPGRFLAWDRASGSCRVIERSPAWIAHARTPRGRPAPTAGETPPEQHAVCGTAPERDGLLGRYSAMIGRVRESGAEPLLFVESCGERYGLAAPDRLGEWSRYAQQVGRELERFASELSVGIADPYPAMIGSWPGLPTHDPGDHRWNVTGHRIAAQCLHGALGGRGLIPSGKM